MALEKKKADEQRMAIEAQVNMEMYMKEKENMIRRSISPNRTNSLTMRTSGTHETKNYTYYTTSGAANLADIKLQDLSKPSYPTPYSDMRTSYTKTPVDLTYRSKAQVSYKTTSLTRQEASPQRPLRPSSPSKIPRLPSPPRALRPSVSPTIVQHIPVGSPSRVAVREGSPMRPLRPSTSPNRILKGSLSGNIALKQGSPTRPLKASGSPSRTIIVKGSPSRAALQQGSPTRPLRASMGSPSRTLNVSRSPGRVLVATSGSPSRTLNATGSPFRAPKPQSSPTRPLRPSNPSAERAMKSIMSSKRSKLEEQVLNSSPGGTKRTDDRVSSPPKTAVDKNKKGDNYAAERGLFKE